MSSSLEVLIELGRVDASIASTAARRLKVEKELAQRQKVIKEAERDLMVATRAHEELDGKIKKEERLLKEEDEKLVHRRKALATFSNYKVQQGAEREIELAGKSLRVREEGLLKVMGDLEVASQKSSALKEKVSALAAELESWLVEARDIVQGCDVQLAKGNEKRVELRKGVEPKILTEYERTVVKIPSDPIVPVESGACTACRMAVGPQIVLQIHRGVLSKCPGCRRILYVPSTGQAAEAT
jgi:predicted  nucleic acid-binding Zn-ribbon protein